MVFRFGYFRGMTIIPEANHALRADLLLYVRERDEAAEARIINQLQNEPVVLFILVTGKVGADDEPPITAGHLSLMHLPDKRPVGVILATTKLTPDNISSDLETRGIYIRPVLAKTLLSLCLQRGVVVIKLDDDLETECTIGPIMKDRDLMVRVVDRP